jgi:hypothetical protein
MQFPSLKKEGKSQLSALAEKETGVVVVREAEKATAILHSPKYN